MSRRRRESSNRIAMALEYALGAAACTAFRYPFRTLGSLVGLTFVSIFLAQDLELDADLAQLVPDTFPSIQDLKQLADRSGGGGHITILGQGAEPDKLIAFADEIAAELRDMPWVSHVDAKRSSEFFRERALYFLPKSDLLKAEERLKERIDWERRNHGPFALDLEDDPPPLEFNDLGRQAEDGNTDSWIRAQMRSEVYYLDREARTIVVMATADQHTLDLGFSKALVDQVQYIISQVDRSKYGPDFTIGLTGRHKKRSDLQQALESDLGLVSLVSVAGILLYVAFHFQRLAAIGLIMVPLGIGLSLTFAFAHFAFDTLNILTGFIGAILLGLGIDHGIHLLGRYECEIERNAEPFDAIQSTFRQTGRAVTVAAVTTMVGFLCLGFSEFRAFHEFGILAGAGMALVVLSYTLCLPAALSALHRMGWRPRRSAGGVHESRYATFVQAHSGKLAISTGVLLLLALFTAPAATFDYDFGALEASDLPSFRLYHEANRILGFSQAPVAILTETEADERYLIDHLNARRAKLGDASTILSVTGSVDLLPQQQAEKQVVLQRMQGLVKSVRSSWLKDKEQREYFTELKRMLKAEPFDRTDFPDQVRRIFGGKTVGEQGVVLVFPSVSLNEGTKLLDFAHEVRDIRMPDGRTVSGAGEDMIMADILAMVMRESPPISVAVAIAVLLVLRLLLGRTRDMLLCLFPAVLTLTVLIGLLPLVGLQVNYLNMVMFPVLFGVGVDGGAHVVTRLRSGQAFGDVLSDTGRAVSGAILTTGLGFGALALANHAGLRSLGLMAALGLLVNLLACLVALPAALRLFGGGNGTGELKESQQFAEPLASPKP